jgi:hypothetical protein
MKTRLILIALSPLVISCLHPVRESAFRVQGSIQGPNLSPTARCEMEVVRSDSGRVVKKMEVERTFTESVVVQPGVRKYFFVVSCAGSRMTYKSREYELGRAKDHATPVDLGTIALPQENGQRSE